MMPLEVILVSLSLSPPVPNGKRSKYRFRIWEIVRLHLIYLKVVELTMSGLKQKTCLTD